MTVIAQISDIHFGSEAAGEARALVEELNRDPVDLVVLSGDLTLAAREEEFRKAQKFIASLDAPTLSVPGNHDITPYDLFERFTRPYKRWRRHIGPDLEPTWSNGAVSVVGLNTARRMRFRLNWSHGSVSRRQMRSLPGRFAALPDSLFRIVVAHHPFLEEETDNLGTRPRVMVARAREALQSFADQNVDLVAAGHLHRTYSAAFEGPPIAGAPENAPGQRVTTVQAGTALSGRRRGEENSFNRIEIRDDVLRVYRVARREGGWHRADVPLAEIVKQSGTVSA